MIPVFTIQGFTEDLAHETGTEWLYKRVIRKFSGPEVTTTWPMPWDVDTAAVAAFALRQGFAEAVIVGYSWGAGYGAQRLAEELGELGIRVRLMLLCDPVYRPRWLPAWMGAFPLVFRALGRTARVRVPASVKRVAWVRQRENLPAGHDLKADDLGRTTIEDPLWLRYRHTAIDQAPEWFELVEQKLKEELT